MDSITELLEEMEDILDSSRAVPFSNKVSVNKDDLYDIIRDIRTKLPTELKQSQWVLDERNKILIDAQKEADEILKNAEDRVSRLVDASEVNRRAHDQASLIIENAKRTAKEMRMGALDYAEQVLVEAEGYIREVKKIMYGESIKTDNYLADIITVVSENIKELKESK